MYSKTAVYIIILHNYSRPTFA